MSRKMNILVIDDDETIRELLAMVLELEGYDFSLAGDGEEGLEKIKNNKIDCVILDLLMPIMEGLLFLKVIRKQLNIDVPVIVLSAFYRPGIEDEARNAGATEFIFKPVEARELIKQIIRFTGA